MLVRGRGQRPPGVAPRHPSLVGGRARKMELRAPEVLLAVDELFGENLVNSFQIVCQMLTFKFVKRCEKISQYLEKVDQM